MSLNFDFTSWNIHGAGSISKLWKIKGYAERNRFAIINMQETMVNSLGFTFAKVFPCDLYHIFHNNCKQGMVTLIRKDFTYQFSFSDISTQSTLAHSLNIKTEVGEFKLLFIYCPPSEDSIPLSILSQFSSHNYISGDLNCYTDAFLTKKFRNSRESGLYDYLENHADFFVASNFITWKNFLDRGCGPDICLAETSSNFNFETRKGNLLISDHYSIDNFGNFLQEKPKFKQVGKSFDYSRIDSEQVEIFWDSLKTKPSMVEVSRIFDRMLSICFSGKKALSNGGSQSVAQKLVNFTDVDQVDTYFEEMVNDANELNFVGKSFKILNFLKSNTEDQINSVDVTQFSPNIPASEKFEFLKFVDIVSKKFDLTPEKKKNLGRIKNWWRNYIKRRNFTFFSKEEFVQAIGSINKQSVGLDHLHVKFWPKKTANLEKFRWAVNGFLFSGKRFSVSTLKQKMKFIPKGGGKLRPLNIGSRLVNLYSTLVSNCLGNFLSTQNFFNNRFGFLPGRNVDLLKYEMNNYVREASESRLKTNLVSMDLRSAYLMCNPYKLVVKLHRLVVGSNEVENLGVCLGYCLKWVAGLNIRKIYWYDSETGKNLMVIMKSGLSQGDSVSAVYFVVYFDFNSGSVEVRVLFFADDSNALVSAESWDSADALTSSYINEFAAWALQNDLEFSHEKSKILSLHRRNSPSKIADVPVVKNSSLRVLGIYVDGNWNLSKHVEFLENFFKIRGNLMQMLRLRLNLGFKCLTNMVLNLRNRITFGTFYLLELSSFQFTKLDKIWVKFLRKTFGFSKLVPGLNLCNFLGILDFKKYAGYWFAKWWITLVKFGKDSGFERYYDWKKAQPEPKKTKYNFRNSTLKKQAESVRKVTDCFGTVFKQIVDQIKPDIQFLHFFDASQVDLGMELKKRYKSMRIYKILDDQSKFQRRLIP